MRFVVNFLPKTAKAGAVAITIAALSSTSVQAEVCSTQSDSAVLTTRVLQAELMVAALSCGQKDVYANFVDRFSDTLIDNGASLRAYFKSHYGEKARGALNSFVTRLANQASGRSVRTQNYCNGAARKFAAVMKLDGDAIRAFAIRQPYANSHGFVSCDQVVNADLAADALQFPGTD